MRIDYSVGIIIYVHKYSRLSQTGKYLECFNEIQACTSLVKLLSLLA